MKRFLLSVSAVVVLVVMTFTTISCGGNGESHSENVVSATDTKSGDDDVVIVDTDIPDEDTTKVVDPDVEGDASNEIRQDIEKYVNALKMGQYAEQYEDKFLLPEFTHEHIGELLKYRNEKDIITKYPFNFASSYKESGCELGVYILWTIEFVRIKSVDRELLVAGFPSMNPLLRLRDPDGLVFVYEEARQVVSDAYYFWWTNNKEKALIEIMQINPLENTIYKWH